MSTLDSLKDLANQSFGAYLSLRKNELDTQLYEIREIIASRGGAGVDLLQKAIVKEIIELGQIAARSAIDAATSTGIEFYKGVLADLYAVADSLVEVGFTQIMAVGRTGITPIFANPAAVTQELGIVTQQARALGLLQARSDIAHFVATLQRSESQQRRNRFEKAMYFVLGAIVTTVVGIVVPWLATKVAK